MRAACHIGWQSKDKHHMSI